MTMNRLSDRPRSADTPILLRETQSGIAILTLNHPDTRNCLSVAMLGALSEALDVIAADRAVRAVVLAANGPAFSAGHDPSGSGKCGESGNARAFRVPTT